MVREKEGDRPKVWLSVDDGVLPCMFLFVLLRLCALCLVFIAMRECKFKVDLTYLPLQGFVGPMRQSLILRV